MLNVRRYKLKYMDKSCGYCKNFPGDFCECEFCENMIFSDTVIKKCEYFIAILCL